MGSLFFAVALGVASAGDPLVPLQSKAFVLCRMSDVNPRWNGKLPCAVEIPLNIFVREVHTESLVRLVKIRW